jgi:hypothetical protein
MNDIADSQQCCPDILLRGNARQFNDFYAELFQKLPAGVQIYHIFATKRVRLMM